MAVLMNTTGTAPTPVRMNTSGGTLLPGVPVAFTVNAALVIPFRYAYTPPLTGQLFPRGDYVPRG
jgi:hypothetical protein